MIKRLAVLTMLCVMPAFAAQAVDVKMGDVTLKLPLPKAYCELDAAQPSDKRLVDFVTATVGKSGNDLLSFSADCQELNDWRTGKRPLLQHYSQYQAQNALRQKSFSVPDVKATCDEIRRIGQQISDRLNIKDRIHEVNKNIDFQGQTVLGVLEDDANGCYVGLLQKFKAETGAAITQINVFYAGSIKNRQVFFYMWTPYQDDSTVNKLLVDVKGNVALLKSQNGL